MSYHPADMPPGERAAWANGFEAGWEAGLKRAAVCVVDATSDTTPFLGSIGEGLEGRILALKRE